MRQPTRSTKREKIRKTGPGFLCLLSLLSAFFWMTPSAYAHPGHGMPGLLHGFFHPIEGMDHLLTALSVGLLGAQVGGRARFGFPLAFICGMILGGSIGFGGVSLPLYEVGILLSCVLLGFALMMPLQITNWWIEVGIAIFGAFHGNAHALEGGAGFSVATYSIGFTTMTLLLHLMGVALVAFLNQRFKPALTLACSRIIGLSMWAILSLSLLKVS